MFNVNVSCIFEYIFCYGCKEHFICIIFSGLHTKLRREWPSTSKRCFWVSAHLLYWCIRGHFQTILLTHKAEQYHVLNLKVIKPTSFDWKIHFFLTPFSLGTVFLGSITLSLFISLIQLFSHSCTKILRHCLCRDPCVSIYSPAEIK